MNKPAHDWALLKNIDDEEQLNQEWWRTQDSDEEWILSQQENDSGYDAVRGK